MSPHWMVVLVAIVRFIARHLAVSCLAGGAPPGSNGRGEYPPECFCHRAIHKYRVDIFVLVGVTTLSPRLPCFAQCHKGGSDSTNLPRWRGETVAGAGRQDSIHPTSHYALASTLQLSRYETGPFSSAWPDGELNSGTTSRSFRRSSSSGSLMSRSNSAMARRTSASA
jgi:hypothetical protein